MLGDARGALCRAGIGGAAGISSDISDKLAFGEGRSTDSIAPRGGERIGEIPNPFPYHFVAMQGCRRFGALAAVRSFIERRIGQQAMAFGGSVECRRR